MFVLLVLMGLYFDSGHSREYLLDKIDLLPTAPKADPKADSVVINGYKDYTQLHVGNLNIFISVPHGGSLMPSSISNRTNDAIGNMKQDLNTQAFGEALRTELQSLFQAKNGLDVQPFLLYNQLHRIKMDPNRNNTECCQSVSEDSRVAYDDYHRMINSFFEKSFMLDGPYEQGLLLDIHGQSHPETWIELGYLLKSSELDGSLKNVRSSIYHLASVSSHSHEQLIRGESVSLGGILEKKYNLKTVPSPSYPSPSGGNYYSGGYITQVHSAFLPQNAQYRLSAIQCELPYYMRANASMVKTYAKQFASAVYDFYWINSFDSTKLSS